MTVPRFPCNGTIILEITCRIWFCWCAFTDTTILKIIPSIKSLIWCLYLDSLVTAPLFVRLLAGSEFVDVHLQRHHNSQDHFQHQFVVLMTVPRFPCNSTIILEITCSIPVCWCAFMETPQSPGSVPASICWFDVPRFPYNGTIILEITHLCLSWRLC